MTSGILKPEAPGKWPRHGHNIVWLPQPFSCVQRLLALRSKPSMPPPAFTTVWISLHFEGQIQIPSFTHRTTAQHHAHSDSFNKRPLLMPTAGHTLTCMVTEWTSSLPLALLGVWVAALDSAWLRTLPCAGQCTLADKSLVSNWTTWV